MILTRVIMLPTIFLVIFLTFLAKTSVGSLDELLEGDYAYVNPCNIEDQIIEVDNTVKLGIKEIKQQTLEKVDESNVLMKEISTKIESQIEEVKLTGEQSIGLVQLLVTHSSSLIPSINESITLLQETLLEELNSTYNDSRDDFSVFSTQIQEKLNQLQEITEKNTTQVQIKKLRDQLLSKLNDLNVSINNVSMSYQQTLGNFNICLLYTSPSPRDRG